MLKRKSDSIIDLWSTWHGSSHCSVSCGGGFRTRSRSCHHHHSCEGSLTRTESCNTQPCPVDGGWSSWQSTAQCSVTCGGGVIKRTRTCNYPPPANGGYQCQGKSLKSEHCNTNPCPVNGEWSSWQNPSQCTVTCGGGLRVRTRSCTNPTPANGGQQCVGLFFGSESCNTHPCPGATLRQNTTKNNNNHQTYNNYFATANNYHNFPVSTNYHNNFATTNHNHPTTTNKNHYCDTTYVFYLHKAATNNNKVDTNDNQKKSNPTNITHIKTYNLCLNVSHSEGDLDSVNEDKRM
uniref:Hemicentin-1 n=1 Tax=Magallana gigas TaxID=29159 RepID=K1RKA6_MAGGI